MPAETPRRASASVASVGRAMRALQAVAEHTTGVTLTRLSAQLGYGKASLSKILGTMEREGFVHRDAAGQYHLSMRLLGLAFGHAQRVGVSGLSAPVLQALADRSDELVQLAVIEDEHVMFVAKAEGPGQMLRMLPLVGVIAPTHATASGKVWLASLPDARALDVAQRQGLPRVTPRTITSNRQLLAELGNIRRQGYAITDEELVQGGRAIAAPILHAAGVVGAVAVSGPSFRLPLSRLRRLAPLVQRAAADLAALWPHHVTARDFGLGVRPGNDHASAGRARRKA